MVGIAKGEPEGEFVTGVVIGDDVGTSGIRGDRVVLFVVGEGEGAKVVDTGEPVGTRIVLGAGDVVGAGDDEVAWDIMGAREVVGPSRSL